MADSGGSGYTEMVMMPTAGRIVTPEQEHSAQVATVELCGYDVAESKRMLGILGLDRRVVDDDGEGD